MPRPRAVVTGGAGFLGSHLCERLLDDGYDVRCLDNFLTGTPANVAHLLERGDFRLIRADVTDFVHVSGDVDVVLHLASPASPIDYLQLPIETLKVGSIGTLHTLGLAREKRARYLLASTSETYGDPQVHPQPESYWGHVNPVGPRGVYDEAKRFAEAMTVAYRTYHGIDTAIVRIFNTFGPRMRPNDGRRSRPSFARRWPASRSPSSVTARRPARCATSTTSSRASSRCCTRSSQARSTSATRTSCPCSRWPSWSATWSGPTPRSSSPPAPTTTRESGSPTSRWRAPRWGGRRWCRWRRGWPAP